MNVVSGLLLGGQFPYFAANSKLFHSWYLADRPEHAPMLISIIGNDSAGDLLLQHWQSLKLPSSGILRKAGVTTPMTSYIFNAGKRYVSLTYTLDRVPIWQRKH